MPEEIKDEPDGAEMAPENEAEKEAAAPQPDPMQNELLTRVARVLICWLK